MNKNKLIGLAVVVLVAALAIWQFTGGNAVDTSVIGARQAGMKDLGKQMGIINGFVEKGEGDVAAVAAAAKVIAGAAEAIPGLFPAGTGMEDGVDKNGAKPEIWSNMDGFKAAAAKLGELAAAVDAAAATGDKAAIAAAFGALGKDGCGGCHSVFRHKES